jgi:hypothetical protein
MFDPTAFENLKVVIEGAVYDRDLSGEILVTDRHDLINLAKLGRRFEISFIDQNGRGDKVTAILALEANIENLAAELLPAVLSEQRAGCHVEVKFKCVHPNDLSFYQKIDGILKDIWGNGRKIEQRILLNPFDLKNDITNEISIHFNRLIYEDQSSDIISMVDFMITSIKELKKLFQ